MKTSGAEGMNIGKDKPKPVRIPPRMAHAKPASLAAPPTPGGTAEATKQNLEAQPHPSKKIDPAASQANQSGPGEKSEGLDFIRRIIQEDIRTGKWGGRIATRFPPEPNGYLHIGHAKSICLNFGVALEQGGVCHLRFDDTNPTKEDVEYVEAIQRDVRWLGFDWGSHLFYASDYFERLYEFATALV